MSDMQVTLTWSEVVRAADVGVQRQVHCLKDNRKDAHDFDGEPWSTHISGAMGELAAAKGLGIYWPGYINNWKDPDLGENLQVRTQALKERPEWNGLLMRKGDNPDHIYILVIGAAPSYHIVGWIWGHMGMVPEYWKDLKNGRKPCFVVPQDALNPMETLWAEIRREELSPEDRWA